jgi:hypothetical protein
MSRAGAIVLVQRITDANYASDDEVDGWLDRLDGALSCPTGHVSDLIFWPPERELSADEVVDHALAYRPVALCSRGPGAMPRCRRGGRTVHRAGSPPAR